MARMARVVIPGIPHHITQRGNRKQKVFFYDEDYRLYIQLISRFCVSAQIEVWAYCLMPNHVHLVVVPNKHTNLALAIGEAHRRYTRYINYRENWRGYLWQGRFASFPMDESYLYSTVRYVERNPVKANLVSSPELWEWSSARAHLKGTDDDLVKVEPMLQRIGNWSEYLTMNNSNRDDDLIRLHGRTGRPLGSESFVDLLEDICGRSLRPLKPGPKAR